MDIKDILKKVKANKYAFAGTSAFGSLLVGIGITGVAMSPSYVYVVGGISGNFGSKGAIEAWLDKEGTIIEHEVNYRSVGGAFLIPTEQWDDYVFSIYSGLYGNDTEYLTDQVIDKDDTGLITTVVNARTAADYVEIYKDADENISLDEDVAANSFLKNVDVFRNPFTGSSFNAHFATAAEAEKDWEDKTVAARTYDSRVEYQYETSGWDVDESVVRDPIITREEGNITHTPEVAATPGTESDYVASAQYITDRDEWIVENGGDETAYLASAEYTANTNSWIAANPDFGNTAADEYWTYDSSDYATEAQAKNAVESYVDTLRTTRTVWSHDQTNYDYDSQTDAREAYRSTLNPAVEVSTVTFYYSDGAINVAHNQVEADVLDGIKARLSSKQGFATATGNYDAYAISSVHKYEYNTSGDVYYDSTDSIAAAFEIDSNIQYTEVVEYEYSLEIDKEETKFDSEESLKEFWMTQIKRIKK